MSEKNRSLTGILNCEGPVRIKYLDLQFGALVWLANQMWSGGKYRRKTGHSLRLLSWLTHPPLLHEVQECTKWWLCFINISIQEGKTKSWVKSKCGNQIGSYHECDWIRLVFYFFFCWEVAHTFLRKNKLHLPMHCQSNRINLQQGSTYVSTKITCKGFPSLYFNLNTQFFCLFL